MRLQIICFALILTGIRAVEEVRITKTGLQTYTFWNRVDGDSLVYTHTKISVPSEEYKYHQVTFNWNDPLLRATQLVLECNGNCSALVVGSQYYSKLYIYASAQESRQVIATVFIYALSVGPGVLNPDDVEPSSLNT